MSEFKVKMDTMKQELADNHESAMKSFVVEKERMIEDAKEQAKHIEEQAHFRIEQNLQRAKNEIRDYLVEESIKLATTNINQAMNKGKQKTLVNDFIEQFKKAV